MNAYEEGADAYYRGDDISMNPYDDRDAQFDEWEDGYSDAKPVTNG